MKATKNYPIAVQVRYFKTDVSGDPIDREGQILRGECMVIGTLINSQEEESDFYESLYGGSYKEVI